MSAPDVCLDCGAAIARALDELPLCDECLRVAAAIGVAPADRVRALRGKRGRS